MLAQRNAPAAPAKPHKGRIVTEEASPLPASSSGPGPPTIARSARSPASRRRSASRSTSRPPSRRSRARAAGQRQRRRARSRTYFGEPIDLKVTNADVTDVLRTFAQISGLNVIVQPGVTGTVTAELENVPWDQALEQVLKINNLDYELDGNVMRIAPTDTLRQEAQERQQLAAAKALSIPLRTVYQRLSYANAQQVARCCKTGQSGLLTQRGSVVVDRRTNALIIKELPTNMDAVLSVIDLLDAPEPQVMIEARIVETTKRFSRDLGVNWGVNGDRRRRPRQHHRAGLPEQRHRHRRGQPARQRQQRHPRPQAGQRAQHLQPRRRPAGGGERGADHHPLGAEGGDAQQPAGRRSRAVCRSPCRRSPTTP